MAEYISREAAIEAVESALSFHSYAGGVAANAIAKLPTADVVPMDFHERCLQIEIQKRMALEKADVRPVVRGEWELDSDPGEPWRYVCNICGEKTKDTVMGKPRANFCPNCGAMMEES